MKKFKNLRSAAGFTLVELIVVIAILGILAGVGSVGYAGYVKSAAKKADMATVNSIIRTIEIGNNSYAFTVDGVQQLDGAEIEIPVGFIVLTENGITPLQSSAGTTSLETNACNIAEISMVKTIIPNTTFTWTGGCGEESAIGNLLEIVNVSNVCLSHSDLKIEYIENYGESTTAEMTDGVGKFYVMDGSTLRYGDDAASGTCSANNKMTVTIYTGGGAAVTAGVLDDVMKASFGDGYAQTVKLQSSEWTEASIPDFYKNAGDYWGKIKTTSDNLLGQANALVGIKLTDSYANSDELMLAVAGRVMDVHVDVDSFMAAWDRQGEGAENLYDSTWKTSTAEFGGDDYGGLGILYDNGSEYTGAEYYASMRQMYNTFFADYVRTNMTAEHSAAGGTTHANNIENFKSLDQMIRQVCTSAFAYNGSSLSAKAMLAGQGFHECAHCRKLYADYVTSGKASEAGREFYNTMKSLDATGAAIAGAEGVSIWDYYGSYLEEFDNLYSAVDTYTNGKSAIVIAVKQKGGKLFYDVSPLEAKSE